MVRASEGALLLLVSHESSSFTAPGFPHTFAHTKSQKTRKKSEDKKKFRRQEKSQKTRKKSEDKKTVRRQKTSQKTQKTKNKKKVVVSQLVTQNNKEEVTF